ncbi:hypothetical protein AVEN_5479-1 [Araneus ventricosus]|uniref:Uncharacterized protein n=1 Tax=Araneus ventricosus TaxID=182803 RepID=A0A4Y2E6B7_ARAVE|nr:hypothetical protein AVEN_5479-1 [Araneus ventricosus]
MKTRQESLCILNDEDKIRFLLSTRMTILIPQQQNTILLCRYHVNGRKTPSPLGVCTEFAWKLLFQTQQRDLSSQAVISLWCISINGKCRSLACVIVLGRLSC